MNQEHTSSALAPGIDWAGLHRRLTEARTSLERTRAPSPEEQKRILKERALALAQPQDQPGAGEQIELVAFQLANERYGFETIHVREIMALKDLTPLPTAPPFVAGILNVRGQVFSVIDLKTLFELPRRGLIERPSLVLLQSEAMELGVLVDDILGVQWVSGGDLQSGLPTLTGVREEYLRGLTPERLILLDAVRLLADPRLVVQEEVQ